MTGLRYSAHDSADWRLSGLVAQGVADAGQENIHITHLDNLSTIASDGLWSDAKRLELGLSCEVVGMSSIKERRLEVLDVKCHPGTKVGEYVPFYFCPRSIALHSASWKPSRVDIRGWPEPHRAFAVRLESGHCWAEANGFSGRSRTAMLARILPTFSTALMSWTSLTGVQSMLMTSRSPQSKRVSRRNSFCSNAVLGPSSRRLEFVNPRSRHLLNRFWVVDRQQWMSRPGGITDGLESSND